MCSGLIPISQLIGRVLYMWIEFSDREFYSQAWPVDFPVMLGSCSWRAV
jgi:hypothetical protein